MGISAIEAGTRRKPDLALLHRALAEAGRRADARDRRREILRLLVDLTNAAAGAYFLEGPAGALEAVVGTGEGTESDTLRQAAETACAERRLIRTSGDGRGPAALASPLEGSDGPIGAVALLLYLGASPAETFATVLQLAAALAAELERRETPHAHRTPSPSVLSLLEEIRTCPDADTAGLTVAEAIGETSGADHVAIGLIPAGKRRPARLAALSGVTEFDRRSDLVRTLEDALTSVLEARACRIWRGDSQAAAPELRAAAGAMNAREIWTLPIVSTGTGIIGALALLFSDTRPDGEERCRDVEEVTAVLADTLDAFRRGVSGEALPRPGIGRRGKALIGLALSIAVGGLLLLPVAHRLTATVVLEPEVRRFVVAPFDGVLEASRVKPGDRVAEGEVLATLDGRELELEAVRLRAERDKLLKQRDVALATGDTAATQVAGLELARIEAGLGLLEYRRDNLEVDSPIDGVVTQGDLSREQGSPVATGQRLFELAPLDRMVAEVELPAEEIAYFEEGAPAELRLDAFPGEVFEGPVDRLFPRATVREGRNVFLAEIELGNPDLRLHPGMRGEARIEAGRRALGWVLFHRAWEKALQWLM